MNDVEEAMPGLLRELLGSKKKHKEQEGDTEV